MPMEGSSPLTGRSMTGKSTAFFSLRGCHRKRSSRNGVGGATLLLPSLDHSPALKLARRHLVESSQESGLHAGELFERWAVVGSQSATVGTEAGKRRVSNLGTCRKRRCSFRLSYAA